MDQSLGVNPAYPNIQQFEPQLEAARSKNQRDTRMFIIAGCALTLLAAGAAIGAGFGFRAYTQAPLGAALRDKLFFVFLLPSTALGLGIGAGFCLHFVKHHTDHEKKKLEELLKSEDCNRDRKVEYYLKYQHKFTANELFDNFYKPILEGKLHINPQYHASCDFESLINKVRQALIEERKSNQNRGWFPMDIASGTMLDLVKTALTSNVIDQINPRAREMILEAFGGELRSLQIPIQSSDVRYFTHCERVSVILVDVKHLQNLSQSCNTLTLDCKGLQSSEIPEGLSLPYVRTLTLSGLQGQDPLLVSRLVNACPRLDTLHLADQQVDQEGVSGNIHPTVTAINAIRTTHAIAVHVDYLSRDVRIDLQRLASNFNSIQWNPEGSAIVHIRPQS